jgi:hypothetical protein
MQQCHTLIYKYISIVRNAYFMQCIVDGMVLVLLELFPVTQTTKCNTLQCMPLFVRIRPKFVRKRISSLSTKFRVLFKKKTAILPSRNFHIYWPLFLMQITTPSSPDTLRYKVWFPSFDLEQTDNWGTFGLGRRLRNIFNFPHTHTHVYVMGEY